MKKILLVLFVIINIFSINEALAKTPKIGFVNIQKAYDLSNFGKVHLEQVAKKLQSQAMVLRKEYIDVQKNIAKNSGNKLKLKSKKIIKQYESAIYKLKTIYDDNKAKFNISLYKASQIVAKEDNLQSVLPANISLYYKNNITQKVVNQMNKQIN